MSRSDRVSTAVILAVTGALLCACESGELIRSDGAAGLNGSFEITEDGIPVNWAFFPNPEADSTFQIALDSEHAVDGIQSLKVTTKPSEMLAGFRSRRVQVQPGKDYRLSLSFKNEGCSLKVRRIVQDASGKTVLRRDFIIDTSAPLPQWEAFEEILLVSGDEANVLLIFLVDGSGRMWFDDVKVEEIAE